MRLAHRVVLVALLVLGLVGVSPAREDAPRGGPAVSYENVLDLLKRGHEEADILKRLEKSPTVFILGKSQEDELKKAGASDRLLSYLRGRSKQQARIGDITDFVIVLDCSGSMADRTGKDGAGPSKMEVARKVVTQLIEKIPSGRNVAFIVYGHDAEQKCKAVKVVQPMSELTAVARGRLKQAIARLKPAGHTPIALSLEVAGKELAKSEGLSGLILLTDGMETCHGDPKAEAARLAKNPRLKLGVHVVGFGVDPREREAVEGIAKAGKGEYYDARSSAELINAFQKLEERIAPVAEPAKVEKKEGHVTPLVVEITGADGKRRQALLTGVRWNLLHRWRYYAVGAGKGEVTLWLDTLREIGNIDDDEATITLKDGSKQTLKHDRDGGGPKLVVAQAGGDPEEIPLKRLKGVRFLRPARKDGEDRAMFDHWLFSPFTGEKLPKDRFASAKPLMVEKKGEHVSPLVVEITGADGKRRQAMLAGARWNGFHRWRYYAVGPGKGEVTLWLDTLREIGNIDDDEATYTFKDGKKQTLRHDMDGGGPKLVVVQAGGGQEAIPLKRLKNVRFLKPARKDSEDGAMFDHWLFSPFTGEKLPKGKE